MGGGLARHELATAVSDAGGLGTIGMLDARDLRLELRAARERSTQPIAVNLLLPFARAAHFAAADAADVIVTFWGRPRRRTRRLWFHQCGSVEEALAARDAGADAVIVQGVESGGHVRGELPALELLAGARRALPPNFPILVAGGIASASDVRAAIDAGADACVVGTRFLMTDESRAHAEYKRRLTEAEATVLTDLFGFGWPARHRVVANAMVERWGPRAPLWMRAVHELSVPLARAISFERAALLARVQRPAIPLLVPRAPTDADPLPFVDAAPLYAGETVRQIGDIRPAASVVRDLAG